jgi:hypothetical protein
MAARRKRFTTQQALDQIFADDSSDQSDFDHYEAMKVQKKKIL